MTTTTRRTLGVVLCLLLGAAAACGSDDDDSDAAGPATTAAETDLEGTITVFVAASLTDAFEEAADEFMAAHPGVTVELNLAASSALREQILAGAPSDVFASANASNMDQVVEAGAAEDPEILVRNVLEIAVPPATPPASRAWTTSPTPTCSSACAPPRCRAASSAARPWPTPA